MRHEDPYAYGAENEARFLILANSRGPLRPAWFRGIIRASPSIDARGVDMLAKIVLDDNPKIVHVPVELKSSDGGKVHYFEKHPWAAAKKVVVIVIGQRTDVQLLEHFYAMLGRVHAEGRRYSGFYQWLLSQPLGSNGPAYKKHIRQSRAALQAAE